MNDFTHIKTKIKNIPELPGIYKMLDQNNNIIYIGKSKSLRKRVRSYFVNSPKWEKVSKMVSFIKDIDYIVTDTHLEARLLECDLIKKLQPRFNAQMKNDRRYIYIKVHPYNPHHSMSVVSEREEDCFGPFRNKYAMMDFLGTLRNIYPISKAEDNYTFDYNIFPVKMTSELFEQNRKILLELLSDDSRLTVFIDYIQLKLEEAALQYRYEIASYYRDMKIGFQSMKYNLEKYKLLSSRNILLKLPVQEGYKLLFISDGCLKNSLIVGKLTKTALRNFIKVSSSGENFLMNIPESEKSHIDYRDIIFSEINDLPEDMVEYL